MSVSTMVRLLFSLLYFQTLIHAQADPNEALLQIRKKVAEDISHLPNYLCTETISREVRQIDSAHHGANACGELLEAVDSPRKTRLVSTDRLRLDVALSSQSEMYSWVGEGRFDDRDLSQIVKQGTTSTGAFGTFLHAIFVSGGTLFNFKDQSEVEGRTILTYEFAVPLNRSGYYVSNNLLSRVAGYHGTFEADAKTLELLKLDIRTDPLPPELKVCRTSTSLNYKRVPMNGVEVLLPSEVNVRMVGSDAGESHNRMTFTGCHQFLGESKLSFDDPPVGTNIPAPPAAQAKTIHLSEGLKVRIALAQNIAPATAAAGDPVRGRVARTINDKAAGITIPKGTVVNGRIFALTSIYTFGLQLELGLRWESFEMDGLSHPLNLNANFALSGSAQLRPMRGQFREIPLMTHPEQPGVSFFLFPQVSDNYQIPAGFEVEWVILKPALP